MLLFNCRYLIDQLTEQISSEELSGKGSVALVETIKSIAAQREKYFDSLVPQLLKFMDRDKLTSASVRGQEVEAADVQLAAALKQSFLSLMQNRTSNCQKSMLLLGLSQLGAKEHPRSFSTDRSSEQRDRQSR